ncbi:dihydrofolate reductase [Streptococcus panodentis]|uniref:Dihydrofolate reductase n=1 Tax=Streptococcus panodentis TaxID=1581472 RepID=A0ABS5AUD5_9STRE|nr:MULTISPECIES: dihydrofolate reductase [Streptococcus]KXT81246.1 Dihydrofolate reductase [Streptococcus sp. DD11]MBP2619863.1 dihydrofolate reductase [Streptococcus panodentis]
MTKKIIAIWAQAERGLIGKDQVMPWHLPAELQHFKETTTGHAILMGRVTFEGMKRRVLPNRISLILTRDKDYQIDDEKVFIFNTAEDVLAWYEKQDKNLYIIGGAQVLALFEPYLDELIQTQIEAELEGDTYFPAGFDWSPYQESSSRFYPKDEKNAYNFTVKHYQRKDS